MSYKLGKVGDEIYPGIHIGDSVYHRKYKKHGFVSNILPEERGSRGDQYLVFTPKNPRGEDQKLPVHGSWTTADELELPGPTDEEIAELFGLKS